MRHRVEEDLEQRILAWLEESGVEIDEQGLNDLIDLCMDWAEASVDTLINNVIKREIESDATY